ncbi:hypothetical protein NL676_032143 [Syzygium grande]|nr:hypothetical protein NL676_032143 [Syzygium grande]
MEIIWSRNARVPRAAYLLRMSVSHRRGVIYFLVSRLIPPLPHKRTVPIDFACADFSGEDDPRAPPLALQLVDPRSPLRVQHVQVRFPVQSLRSEGADPFLDSLFLFSLSLLCSLARHQLERGGENAIMPA